MDGSAAVGSSDLDLGSFFFSLEVDILEEGVGEGEGLDRLR